MEEDDWLWCWWWLGAGPRGMEDFLPNIEQHL